jgi:hypothetical protein
MPLTDAQIWNARPGIKRVNPKRIQMAARPGLGLKAWRLLATNGLNLEVDPSKLGRFSSLRSVSTTVEGVFEKKCHSETVVLLHSNRRTTIALRTLGPMLVIAF